MVFFIGYFTFCQIRDILARFDRFMAEWNLTNVFHERSLYIFTSIITGYLFQQVGVLIKLGFLFESC